MLRQLLNLIWARCVLMVILWIGPKMPDFLLTRKKNLLAMALILWVSLLPLVVESKIANLAPQDEGTQISDPDPREEVIEQLDLPSPTTQKALVNWQSDLEALTLKTLMLDLGNETYQKCLSHVNQTRILTSTPTDQSKDSNLLNDVFKMCLYKSKWLMEIPNEHLESRRNFKDFYNMLHFNRNIDLADKKYQDCFYKTRKTVINVPTSCYWVDLDHDRTKEFFNFWNMYGPDIMYLYDFVLYDENNFQLNQNRLWYLIGYLKTLVLHIDDPFSIIEHMKISMIKFDDIYAKIKEVIELIMQFKTKDNDKNVNNNVVVNPDPKPIKP